MRDRLGQSAPCDYHKEARGRWWARNAVNEKLARSTLPPATEQQAQRRAPPAVPLRCLIGLAGYWRHSNTGKYQALLALYEWVPDGHAGYPMLNDHSHHSPEDNQRTRVSPRAGIWESSGGPSA
ncbi:misfolded glycoproteins degradation protein Yos9 [Aspergillus luchuensis]|uniref:Misfolded glycoproteins degradation protein Yos9 n=1 Tax=Aspergillus kawachii TaxID=1069201 RepID=A0A146FC55_ASPKA|nr:misfolded glycoproteins degradation protein Yos9 [Aspergillus luchuensis]